MDFFKKREIPKKCDKFIELPEEILLYIFLYLTIRDLLNLSTTNKKLKRISQDNYSWQQILSSKYDLNINDNCKEIYKLLTLYNNYKHLFVDKTFSRKLIELFLTILAYSMQGPLITQNMQLQLDENSFPKNLIGLENIEALIKHYKNIIKLPLAKKMESDFRDMLNILSTTKDLLPKEKVNESLSIIRKFVIVSTRNLTSDKIQKILSDAKSKRKIEPNSYAHAISIVKNMATYIKNEYLTSYYTPPSLLLVYLTCFTSDFISTEYGVGALFAMALINYTYAVELFNTFHRWFFNKDQLFNRHLESRDVEELNNIFNEVFPSMPGF